MKIRNRLNPSNPCFSFEFFPPKTPDGEANLRKTLEDLRELEPGFVSVTYGAGGSTRDRTVDLVTHIKRDTGIEAMAHLTCVGHSKEELAALLDRLKAEKVDNVLALRGDPPAGQKTFEPAAGGFRYAQELVEFIRERDYPFSLGGAAYPEGHVETASRDADLKNLKAKVDAGLDFLITQLFFDNAFYFDFVERARRAGINIPIVPGIMPITNFDQVHRIVRLCGVTVPMRLTLQLEKVKDDPEAMMQLGIAHATVQCMELLQRGVPGIHFLHAEPEPGDADDRERAAHPRLIPAPIAAGAATGESAPTVSEWVPRQLITLYVDMPVGEAARVMVDRRVGAAPVVDRKGRLLGVMSVNAVKPASGALSVEESVTISAAALQMAAQHCNHVVAVDAAGKAVGMFSAIDLLRWAGRVG